MESKTEFWCCQNKEGAACQDTQSALHFELAAKSHGGIFTGRWWTGTGIAHWVEPKSRTGFWVDNPLNQNKVCFNVMTRIITRSSRWFGKDSLRASWRALSQRSRCPHCTNLTERNPLGSPFKHITRLCPLFWASCTSTPSLWYYQHSLVFPERPADTLTQP